MGMVSTRSRQGPSLPPSMTKRGSWMTGALQAAAVHHEDSLGQNTEHTAAAMVIPWCHRKNGRGHYGLETLARRSSDQCWRSWMVGRAATGDAAGTGAWG
jgi:hypothetical protein